MRIQLYEPWMKDQICLLFSKQYGVDYKQFQNTFDIFYEHAFQKEKCIRIVALVDEVVVGFQSFFYWPYTADGKEFNVYQSGNSIVHEAYRGKGIFQALLNHLESCKDTFKIDCLIGFPIEASKNSLLRNKWINITNLRWYVKLNSWMSIFNLNALGAIQEIFNQSSTALPLLSSVTDGALRLTSNLDFQQWRTAYKLPNSHYFYYNYKQNEHQVSFHLKLNIRKLVIKELIIGDIQSNTQDPKLLAEAFYGLLSNVKKSNSITLVSIALNPLQSNLPICNTLSTFKFKPLEKKIYFLVKPFSDAFEFSDPKYWTLYRSDIDTW